MSDLRPLVEAVLKEWQHRESAVPPWSMRPKDDRDDRDR
jgi:hypothetical protein